jgi:hypothetical protein
MLTNLERILWAREQAKLRSTCDQSSSLLRPDSLAMQSRYARLTSQTGARVLFTRQKDAMRITDQSPTTSSVKGSGINITNYLSRDQSLLYFRHLTKRVNNCLHQPSPRMPIRTTLMSSDSLPSTGLILSTTSRR